MWINPLAKQLDDEKGRACRRQALPAKKALLHTLLEIFPSIKKRNIS